MNMQYPERKETALEGFYTPYHPINDYMPIDITLADYIKIIDNISEQEWEEMQALGIVK